MDAAEQELEKVDIQDEVTDVVCDLCGRNMVIKYGPHGRFLACPGFPDCRNTKPYYEKIGVACPKCGKDVVLKKHRKAGNIMAARTIRNAILCPGRSRLTKNVRYAAVIW